MGSKGATLRDLERKHRAFMFFDNEKVVDDAKTLYVLGEKRNRQGAVDECQQAIDVKMNGRGVRIPSWNERSRDRYDDRRPRDRFDDRRRARSPDRRDDRRRDRSPDRRDRVSYLCHPAMSCSPWQISG